MLRKETGRFLLIISMMVTIIVSLSSCATKKSIQRIPNPQEISKTQARVQVTLNYLSEEQKRLKYGRENNPFLSPVSALRTGLLVFEFRIKAQSTAQTETYRVILNTIELQFGKITTHPLNRFQLLNFWEPRLKQEEYRRWNSSILKKIIKENVLPNELVITSEKSQTGLLVFQGRFPDYGSATIYVPIYNSKNKEITRFIFIFEF